MASNVKVFCIFQDQDQLELDVVKEFYEYCSKNSIEFNVREYNSFKHDKDRNYISELPAFHIYTGKSYFDTTSNQIKIIDDAILSSQYMKITKSRFLKFLSTFRLSKIH